MTSPQRNSDEFVFRLGEFLLDPAAGCLHRNGEDIYLRPKTLAVLRHLVAHRDEIVTKDALLHAVWGDVAVTDDTLVQSIVDLRKALADDPKHPRCIRTIPRAGYRFVGPVDIVPPASAPPPAARAADPDPGPPAPRAAEHEPAATRSWTRWAIAAAALLAVGAAVAWRVSLQTPVAGSVLYELPATTGQPRLVVMPFEDRTGQADLAWLREGLTDMLITRLSQAPSLAVLPRTQLAANLRAAGLKPDAPAPLEGALDVARRSRATNVLIGSFSSARGELQIQLALRDVDTGRLVGEDTVRVPVRDTLTELDTVALHVLARLSVRPTPSGRLVEATTSNIDAYRYYSLGVERAQAFEPSDAIALFQKALDLDPKFAMAHARIGYAYAISWGRTEEAKPHLERAMQLADSLPERDRLLIAAWHATANNDFSEVARLYRRVLAIGPPDSDTYLRLAQVLIGEGVEGELFELLQRGAELDPSNGSIFNTLSREYVVRGRHDEALAMARRYVELTPDRANPWDSVGLVEQWFGRYEEARQAYERALAINPDFEIAAVHLGNLAFQQGRYAAAIRSFERYLKLAPSDGERARAYACLTEAYARLGRMNEAYAAGEAATRIDPGTIFHLQRLALDRGDTARLARVKLMPETSHNNERGVRPNDRFPNYRDGYFALREGRIDEALTRFREALKYRAPIWNIESYEDGLARAYLEIGRWDESIAEYRRILRINPHDGTSLFGIARAYEGKHDMRAADQAYRAFLAEWRDADPDGLEVAAARRALARNAS